MIKQLDRFLSCLTSMYILTILITTIKTQNFFLYQFMKTGSCTSHFCHTCWRLRMSIQITERKYLISSSTGRIKKEISKKKWEEQSFLTSKTSLSCSSSGSQNRLGCIGGLHLSKKYAKKSFRKPNLITQKKRFDHFLISQISLFWLSITKLISQKSKTTFQLWDGLYIFSFQIGSSLTFYQ